MVDRFDDIRADAACCAREYDTDKEKDSSLTDDWKAGKLKCGYFFLRLLNDDITVGFFDGISFSCCHDFGIREIIASCDYDHFVELTEKAKKYDRIKINGNYPDKISKLKSRIKHLLELQANQDKEVENLRELLKECGNELKLFRMLSLPMASKEALDECDDFLTRISSVLGESEKK